MKPDFVACFHKKNQNLLHLNLLYIVEWNLETNGDKIDLVSVDPLILANSLGRFYREAKPESASQNEEPLYHKKSLINIRATFNRHLADLKRELVHDKKFKTPYGILDGLFNKERIIQAHTAQGQMRQIFSKSTLTSKSQ